MSCPYDSKSIILYFSLVVACIACGSDTNQVDETELLDNYVAQQSLAYTEHSSGFYYAILDSGSVDVPTTASTVIITYDLFDLDDMIIEQVDDPLTIDLDLLFDGIITGLRLIGRGGDISLVLPSTLASGSQADSRIASDMPLRIDIGLVEHYTDITDYHQRLIVDYLNTNALPDSLIAGDSYYVLTNPGLFNAITDTSSVSLNYTGYLLDGTIFDDRYSTIDTTVLLSEAIEGWQDVLVNFSLNGTGSMFIPSESAYGTEGYRSVPADTPVAFDFQITGVQ